MALSPGTQMGAYRIVTPLAAGGMGEVYKANDPRLGRDVAIKVLPEQVSKDADRLRRFEQEARATGALNPNILAIYDVGAHEGSPYIVSELLEGETLRSALLNVAIAPRRAIDYATQIASGLAAAHDKGFVHRDLKPENLFITKDGRIKILDFGLAKLTETPTDKRSELPTIASEPGAVLGTVGYMSPEQVRAQTVDHRSDIFSFGAILYEMLSGARAFRRDSAVETMSAILKDEPPEIESKHAAIPPALDRILRRCLEKPAERRFQSALDLGFALENISSTSSSAAAGPAPLDQGKAGQRSGQYSRKALLAAVTATAIVVGIAAAFVTLRSSPPAAGAPEWQGELLGGSTFAYGPRISPNDGKTLAFIALVDGVAQVSVLTPDSGDWSVQTRERSRGGVGSLSWSNDGDRIFFDRFFEQPRGVFSVAARGGGDERLVLEDAMWPNALPDGSLVVTKVNAGTKEIYRFWPESQRLDSLGALPASSLLNSGVRTLPGGREIVFYGRPKGSDAPSDHLYVLDLESRRTRRLAPDAVFPQNDWRFPLAITPDGRSVLFDLPAGDLHQIVSAPADGSYGVRQLFTLTAMPIFLDIGPDESLYVDESEIGEEILRFSPADGNLERFPLRRRSGTRSFVLPLPDGRVVATSSLVGRPRLMVMTPGQEPMPFLQTLEETSGPLTMVGKDHLAFFQGSGANRAVAIATIDGRPAGKLPVKGEIHSLSGSPGRRGAADGLDCPSTRLHQHNAANATRKPVMHRRLRTRLSRPPLLKLLILSFR